MPILCKRAVLKIRVLFWDEIKKIFGENLIPYWERAAYPLVKDQEKILALGSVCALGKQEELKSGDAYYLQIKNLKTGKFI